jgi:hypothetical protein
MPDMTKDVVIAVLGAAVGLAGLLLIFSGFLFAQAAAFPPETTDDATINRYRNAGRFGLAPFLLSLLVAALAFAWMIHPATCIYLICTIGFGTLLLLSAAYGTFVLIRYL